jgi:hypothetical protein
VKQCFKVADKDDDKKESKYQKYIYYALNGYQYHGESDQYTNVQYKTILKCDLIGRLLLGSGLQIILGSGLQTHYKINRVM